MQVPEVLVDPFEHDQRSLLRHDPETSGQPS